MQPKTVYLAGPILDCTKDEANQWRKTVSEELAAHNIIGISPLRCEPLMGERYTHGNQDPKFGTSRAIGSKNVFDVRNCDMVIAFLPRPPAGWLEGRHQSFGTIIEIGWGHIIGKPVIVVSNDPDILGHPVINSSCGWMLETLEDAVETAIGILGGYVGGKAI